MTCSREKELGNSNGVHWWMGGRRMGDAWGGEKSLWLLAAGLFMQLPAICSCCLDPALSVRPMQAADAGSVLAVQRKDPGVFARVSSASASASAVRSGCWHPRRLASVAHRRLAEAGSGVAGRRSWATKKQRLGNLGIRAEKRASTSGCIDGCHAQPASACGLAGWQAGGLAGWRRQFCWQRAAGVGFCGSPPPAARPVPDRARRGAGQSRCHNHRADTTDHRPPSSLPARPASVAVARSSGRSA